MNENLYISSFSKNILNYLYDFVVVDHNLPYQQLVSDIANLL